MNNAARGSFLCLNGEEEEVSSTARRRKRRKVEDITKRHKDNIDGAEANGEGDEDDDDAETEEVARQILRDSELLLQLSRLQWHNLLSI